MSAGGLAAVMLAAGEGKRMRSDRAKVLHEIAGQPLLGHVLDRLAELGVERPVVVVGHRREAVIEYCRARGADWAVQEEQLGTAHAFRQALPALAGFRGTVLVLCGDTPLLTTDTLRRLLQLHRERDAVLTVLSADLDDPSGYGRVLRDGAGDLARIVEEKDASPEARRVREINTAIYALEHPGAAAELDRIDADNRQGEYYLTDLVALLRRRDERVAVWKTSDPREALGVNTVEQLDEAERAMAALRAEGKL